MISNKAITSFKFTREEAGRTRRELVAADVGQNNETKRKEWKYRISIYRPET